MFIHSNKHIIPERKLTIISVDLWLLIATSYYFPYKTEANISRQISSQVAPNSLQQNFVYLITR